MDKKHLTKDSIGPIIDRKVEEAVGWFSSKLSTEREKVIRYYNGELPKRQNSGSSTFISTDVYDAVEGMKAQLLETFAAGKELVHFDPTESGDAEDAQNATEYTDFVIFRQNDGYQIIGDAIHDGLTARVGVAKVWWEECESVEEEEFEDQDEASTMAMAGDPRINSLEAEEVEEGSGVYNGKLTKKTNKNQVRIEVINPEEFAVEPQARSLGPDTFCVHRTIKTIDDLVKMGYNRSDIETWNAEDENGLSSNPELLARFEQIESNTVGLRGSEAQDELRHVIVTECYIKLQLKGDDYAKLYKVLRCGHNTLSVDEVSEHPFVVFAPLPVPHSFYGNNFAARVIPAQNAQTVLTRAIIDHTCITTNPRMQVLKGGLTNPRELLDNRLGGIVNVTRENAITPIQQANLNPFVFETLKLLQSKNEETTGISSLSKGLNKDAISKQNSGDMVDSLVSLSMGRQKIIARNFANSFLVPLYLKVYNLVIANEDRRRMMEVCGTWKEVDPTSWRERRSVSTSLHLGYGDMERDAKKRMVWGAAITQDPMLGHLFEVNGRFNMAKDVAKAEGIHNYLDYLTPPDKAQPVQPDQMTMKKMELEERKIAADELRAQVDGDKVKAHIAIEEMKARMDKMQAEFDNMLKQRDADRKDADTANKVDIAQREMNLLETEDPAANKGIVSPR